MPTSTKAWDLLTVKLALLPVNPLCLLASSLRVSVGSSPPTCPKLLTTWLSTDEAAGAADYTAAQLVFFGPQAVGVGIGGNNAQILLNNNDDFSRFIIMIWSLFAGFETLNRDFITVGYSFVY